jgi:hypothetical protein
MSSNSRVVHLTQHMPLVFQMNFNKLFEAKPNAISTLGICTHEALEESGVDLDCIAKYSISATPPWLLHTPGFNYTIQYWSKV